MAMFLLLSINSTAQKWYKLEKRDILAATSAMFAGAFEGTAETLKWHYHEFEAAVPGANAEYWNPEISWRNKYRDGIPENGPKHFGSTTFLVWTTDGYHLMRTGRNLMFGTTLFLTPRKDSNWKTQLLRVAVYTLAYQAGFHLTYTVAFR